MIVFLRQLKSHFNDLAYANTVSNQQAQMNCYGIRKFSNIFT